MSHTPSLLPTFDPPTVALPRKPYFTLVTYIIGYSVFYGTSYVMIVSCWFALSMWWNLSVYFSINGMAVRY